MVYGVVVVRGLLAVEIYLRLEHSHAVVGVVLDLVERKLPASPAVVEVGLDGCDITVGILDLSQVTSKIIGDVPILGACITCNLQLATFAAALARSKNSWTAIAPAAQPATPDEPDLDEAVLMELARVTDDETVAAVIAMMTAEAPALAEELARHAAASDLVALARTAHRFKGSAGTLGLRRIYALCGTIEQCARLRDLAGAVAHVPLLIQAVGRALPLLTKRTG